MMTRTVELEGRRQTGQARTDDNDALWQIRLSQATGKGAHGIVLRSEDRDME